MVIETNSSFTLVKSSPLRILIAYSNGDAITIYWRTLKHDIQSILYKGLFENIQVQLQEHIATCSMLNLTIDAWTSANKLPFMAITAHWIDTRYERFNTLM